MFSPSFIPRGCEHVATAGVRLATSLGIDAAPAMVGWQLVGGRSLPEFQGVVVPANEAARLRTAVVDAGAALADAERRRLARLWLTLALRLETADRVSRAYT
jgi:xeroderma pigmentosum group C-complementing protein